MCIRDRGGSISNEEALKGIEEGRTFLRVVNRTKGKWTDRVETYSVQTIASGF